MPEPYLLHPIAVHFPIAFLILGFVAACAHRLRPGFLWMSNAASWLLWIGALAVWAALGLGLLAEKTAPHVPPAWETLADHETLGWWSAGLFTALSIWRVLNCRRRRVTGDSRWIDRAFLLMWLISLGVLISTAFHGGELVFTHGMGVKTE